MLKENLHHPEQRLTLTITIKYSNISNMHCAKQHYKNIKKNLSVSQVKISGFELIHKQFAVDFRSVALATSVDSR